MKFYTRFDVAPSLNRNKIYDRHDNVDRVSFVDNTRLIQRFILEGQNLNTVRARALNSGLYTDAEAYLDNSDDVILPVYEQDPTVFFPVVEEAKSRKSRAASRDDDSTTTREAALDSTERVADGKED